ncbi:MAG: helix-turn-helix domain-containing protein [Pseudomonadota bacterium]|nr:helix-turn-helix domain-containing protein [Pseudomonadota bacterium]
MYRALPVIQEKVEDLRQRLRQARDAQKKLRLHLLVLVAEERVSTRQEAAAHLAVHRNTVGQWLERYEQDGLEGLLHDAARGAPPVQRTLSPAAYEALQERLGEAQGFGSYGEIQQWLREQWGEEVDYQAVHRLVYRRLGAKLKRPRPSHPKKTMPRPRPSPSACSGVSRP